MTEDAWVARLPLLVANWAIWPAQGLTKDLVWEDQIAAVRNADVVAVLTDPQSGGLLLLDGAAGVVGRVACMAVVTRRGINGSEVLLTGAERVVCRAVERSEGHYTVVTETLEEVAPRAELRDELVRLIRLGHEHDGLEQVAARWTREDANAVAMCLVLAAQYSKDRRNFIPLAGERNLDVIAEKLIEVLKYELDPLLRQLARKEEADARAVAAAELAEPEDVEAADEAEDDELAGLPEAVREEVKRQQKDDWHVDHYEQRTQMICQLPWAEVDAPAVAPEVVRAALDASHGGLERAKDQLVAMAAKEQFQRARGVGAGGGALLLVGPPGTGKTALVGSLAEALGRPHVVIAPGSDADDIRLTGITHTWRHSGPGEIARALIRAKTRHVLIQIDEIDKQMQTARGSSILAVLLALVDPSQNHAFRDAYLDVPIDLSSVMWAFTANDIDRIHRALVDRCTVIELDGYSDEEKQGLVVSHLLPRARASLGLKEDDVSLSEAAIADLVDRDTEYGVRSLSRSVERALVANLDRLGSGASVVIDSDDLDATPANPVTPVIATFAPRVATVGLSAGVGLAGDLSAILPVQVTLIERPGKMVVTGDVDDLLREQASVVVAWLERFGHELGIAPERLEWTTVCVHVGPFGPSKRGSSVGLAMACSLVSAITEQPIPTGWVLTGEVDLFGSAVSVGGVAEKAAAVRAGGFDLIAPVGPAPHVTGVHRVSHVVQACELLGLFEPSSANEVAPLKSRRARQPEGASG